MRNNKIENRYGYSRRQRICAWLALIGIFVCGMMAGAFIWQTKSTHTADSGLSSAEKIEQFIERNTMPCRVKEETLQQMLTESDHLQNARVYEKLMQIGCERNKEKFANFAQSERELADAMNYVHNPYFEQYETTNDENSRPCEIIERQLRFELTTSANPSSWDRSRNAAIYSKMAEDGCPENAEKYKQFALNELQIADGIKVRDDEVSREEMRYTVDTYKKLQMQQEAKKYLNKVEKLVNPGIDFIMELQRVIEE